MEENGRESKRLKLSQEEEPVAVDLTSSSPNSPPTTTTTAHKLPLCQFGDKCYRRNPAHLTEFFHPLLDKIYMAMSQSGNFSSLPTEFNKPGVERVTILEQIKILKDSKLKMNSSDDKTLSSSSWSSSLSDIREERKRKFLESRQDQSQSSKSSLAVKITTLRKSMLDKWEESRPYNYFLTKVAAIRPEADPVLSANFKDLFDPSLGEISAVAHINFMIDPEWLMEQVQRQPGLQEKPTRIIFDGVAKDMQGLAEAYPWIKVFGVKSPFPFGHHHTKMSLVQYTDLSMRFFIYTANLIESDWENRTQGIWISPRCPKMPLSSTSSDGDSPTKFRSDMIQYLSTYPIQATRAWIDIIKGVDCSEIKVYLIASAPVTANSGTSGFQWGTCKMEKVLKSVVDEETDPSWPLVIQCSSIGTLGKGLGDWVESELGSAFAGKDRVQKGPIHLIYPSYPNVKSSFEGLHGGGCLPYSASTHKKQTWLDKYLCQWKADRSGRSRAVPHIKSYFRMSPESGVKKLAWFLLTSANLSKAAWGKLNKNKDRLSVMSWEAGVLFVPQIMVSQNHFRIDADSSSSESNSSPPPPPPFPLHVDIPVVNMARMILPGFLKFCKL